MGKIKQQSNNYNGCTGRLHEYHQMLFSGNRRLSQINIIENANARLTARSCMDLLQLFLSQCAFWLMNKKIFKYFEAGYANRSPWAKMQEDINLKI